MTLSHTYIHMKVHVCRSSYIYCSKIFRPIFAFPFERENIHFFISVVDENWRDSISVYNFQRM